MNVYELLADGHHDHQHLIVAAHSVEEAIEVAQRFTPMTIDRDVAVLPLTTYNGERAVVLASYYDHAN